MSHPGSIGSLGPVHHCNYFETSSFHSAPVAGTLFTALRPYSSSPSKLPNNGVQWLFVCRNLITCVAALFSMIGWSTLTEKTCSRLEVARHRAQCSPCSRLPDFLYVCFEVGTIFVWREGPIYLPKRGEITLSSVHVVRNQVATAAFIAQGVMPSRPALK